MCRLLPLPLVPLVVKGTCARCCCRANFVVLLLPLSGSGTSGKAETDKPIWGEVGDGFRFNCLATLLCFGLPPDRPPPPSLSRQLPSPSLTPQASTELVNKGADVLVKTRDGKTTAMLCAQKGWPEV